MNRQMKRSLGRDLQGPKHRSFCPKGTVVHCLLSMFTNNEPDQILFKNFFRTIVSNLHPRGWWMSLKFYLSNHLVFLETSSILMLPMELSLNHLISINSGMLERACYEQKLLPPFSKLQGFQEFCAGNQKNTQSLSSYSMLPMHHAITSSFLGFLILLIFQCVDIASDFLKDGMVGGTGKEKVFFNPLRNSGQV